MNRQIGHIFAIILAVVLGSATVQARYLNPNTGRFQTMDTYEGNTQDPASLHKYLYAGDDPVNKIDPSGHEFNLVSLQSSITTISGLAARYVASIPGAARVAFGAGGAAIGRFYNQFGPVVQNFGQQVVNLLPRIEQLKSALDGFTRRPDFLLRAGNALRAIEGKYQLPKAGELSLVWVRNYSSSLNGLPKAQTAKS